MTDIFLMFHLPGCDVINFELTIAFLSNSFSAWLKKSRQKFKYFKNEKSFQDE